MKTNVKLFFQRLFIALGIFFSLAIILSFTSIPFYAYHGLSLPKDTTNHTPQYIITYSAEGMPAPQTLMRIWTTASVATIYPEAKIIIAYPTRSANDTQSINLIKEEFRRKSIKDSRISFETKGNNTYFQSYYIDQNFNLHASDRILIVSSPEHMYRTYGCFKQLGYKNLSTKPAYPKMLTNEVLQKNTTDRSIMLALRYNFWNYLKYEIIVVREYIAITYYKIKGWI